MTAGVLPDAAEVRAASVVTVCGVAVPPPVVVVTLLPETDAQPTSALAAGGVEQLELVPPAPAVPVPAAPVSEPPVEPWHAETTRHASSPARITGTRSEVERESG